MEKMEGVEMKETARWRLGMAVRVRMVVGMEERGERGRWVGEVGKEEVGIGYKTPP